MNPTTTPRQVNRRSGLRRKPCSTVQVECRKGILGLGPNLTLRVLEVSQGGARLLLKTFLKIHDEVEVLISGYGTRPIKRVANVSWVGAEEEGGHVVGLAFHPEIPFIDLQRIAKPC